MMPTLSQRGGFCNAGMSLLAYLRLMRLTIHGNLFIGGGMYTGKNTLGGHPLKVCVMGEVMRGDECPMELAYDPASVLKEGDVYFEGDVHCMSISSGVGSGSTIRHFSRRG